MDIHDISLDWKLEFLAGVAATLDSKLEELDRRSAEVPDPDAWGIYDCYEELYGIGCVLGQSYVAAVCGSLKSKKSAVMACGPRLKNGFTIAEAVNHAANYWKHHEEWPQGRAAKMMEETKKAIAAFGCRPDVDYVLGCVVAAIVDPPHRLMPLMNRLDDWRREVRKNAE
jgi:hypothetical protein